MIPNFSESFVAFCDKIEQSLPEQFRTQRMVDHCGRIAAVSAEFSSSKRKKLLGVMKTALVSHCHEFRVTYAVPTLDVDTLEDWWEFAKLLQKTLVPVDPMHEYSMVSLILICGKVEKPALRKLSGKASEVRYQAPLSGWSSTRLAVVDLGARKVYANRMGSPLRDLLKPLVK